MFAKKNVPFKTISELSFLIMPTINHETEPTIKKQYPIKNNLLATTKAPIMLDIVPNHEILFIILKFPLSDVFSVLAHIVP